jgi:hypothetical protein
MATAIEQFMNYGDLENKVGALRKHSLLQQAKNSVGQIFFETSL